MLGELNRNRYRALELLADHVRMPSRELSLDAIISDISDEDLQIQNYLWNTCLLYTSDAADE